MIIGEILLANDNVTVQLRGFTVISGPRIVNQMRLAWNEISINVFWELMNQVSSNFVTWNFDRLRASNANQIFSQHVSRGARYQFSKSTMSMSSENPRYIFMSIEIDRSR